ncbi:uncharacterized protein LOC129948244 [Eupeodes corollae]|uniref:uncharacterized protein LOC129948244 n=1 Tax=Eupeodes corollae TaxID=290404 RepID=UPI002491327E|nr:uncharacterized protein LOC129948244 [Eupeodes corollae]
MLMCSQLKLSERRSASKLKSCNISGDSIPVVIRPCTQRNITEVPLKITNSTHHHVTEKRSPKLRVVSLHLEDRPNSNTDRKITRAPYRMPLFCTHFKTLQKNHQRDKKDIDENFIVRGFEVGSANIPFQTLSNPIEPDNYLDPDEDDLNFLRNGIRIQLTDCCQCVCDLFHSNFPVSRDDTHDLSYNVTIENNSNSNQLRSFRSKNMSSTIGTDASAAAATPVPSVETQSNGVLDPNILKVIRVTMNNKSLKEFK